MENTRILPVDEQPQRTNWDSAIPVVIFHIMGIWALFYFSWANLAAAMVLWWVAGSLGIGLGYHRMLTHGGFKTPKWLEYFLTTCGALALQSSSVKWVATHRIHHAYTDTDLDPHSPRNGNWWSHVGWIMTGTSQEHPEAVLKKYVPDLLKDKFHLWMYKYYAIPTILLAGVLFLIGGWSMVLWGIFLRVSWGWHMTWIVNSVTHVWGTRRFKTDDDSTNNGLVALLSFGEGWHNNHHAQPSSARHGLTWYEFDQNWLQIRLLEVVGLAKNVKVYKIERNELAADGSNLENAELKRAA